MNTRLAFLTTICLWLLLPGDLDGADYSQSSRDAALEKPTAAVDRKYNIHDGNKILTRIYNFGGIGDWTIGNRLDSGIYPRGTGYSYFAEFSPIVGAEIQDINGKTLHIFSDGMVSSTMADIAPEGYQYGFEPLPGYANPRQDKLAMSNQPETWPASWPNRSSDWDGSWNGQYGKYVRADQESYFVMNDYYNDEFEAYPSMVEEWEDASGSVVLETGDGDTSLVLQVSDGGPIDNVNEGVDGDLVIIRNGVDRHYRVDAIGDDETMHLKVHPFSETSTYSAFSSTAEDVNFTLLDRDVRGLGFEVQVRGYQWSNVMAEDILIFTYWIENTSTTEYEKVVFGMYGDADVGDDGDQHDDYAWFDKTADIVYQYDEKPPWSNAKGGFRPVYFGYSFLESPGDPNDGIDNDEDGMVDESQQDGIDNDGDWESYDDKNGNGKWDPEEPLNDDIGSDGLSPVDNDYPGADPDGSEANGMPDVGEPDFEFTDNDESDQIGLTSFSAKDYPNINISNDEAEEGGGGEGEGELTNPWDLTRPGLFDQIQQDDDLTFLYGSGHFSMAPNTSRKFAIAMVFGEDEQDIRRNSSIMQEIYNADYAFAKPPRKPTLTAVPGDGKVTLYWDRRAEESHDHIYGFDFEGYRIYRATDPTFLDNYVMTDAYGNKTFYKPLAQYDIKNGIRGLHPMDINGIKFNMGNDTGLRYSFVDSTIDNGKTYYYAVTSYDRGHTEEFYTTGIVDEEGLPPIPPSESNKQILTDQTGQVTRLDINTARVVPNAPAAGYQPPERTPFDSSAIAGTGDITVNFIDPMRVRDGNTYELIFYDTGMDGIDNDDDWRSYDDANGNGQWDEGEALRDDVGSDGDPDTRDSDGTQGNDEPDPGEPNLDMLDAEEMLRTTTYYDVVNTTDPDDPYKIIEESTWLGGEDYNGYPEGLQITVDNDSVRPDPERSGFVSGDCNFYVRGEVYYNNGVPFPHDYRIQLADTIVRTDYRGTGLDFYVWDATTGDTVNLVYDQNKKHIIPMIFDPVTGGSPKGTWQIYLESRLGQVQDIYNDTKNRKWIGTQNTGLAIHSAGEWHYLTSGNSELETDNIRQIIQSPDGDYLLGTSAGVLNLLPGQGEDYAAARITGLDTLTGGMSQSVTALLLDRTNRLWVGTTDGIRGFPADFYRSRLLGKRQVRYGRTAGDSLQLPANSVSAIYEDSDGNIWVGTTDGYTKAEPGENGEIISSQVEAVSMPGVRINTFHEYTGVLYAGTNQGLFQYEGDTFVKDEDYAGWNIRDFIIYGNRLWMTNQKGLYALNSDGTGEQYSVNSGHLSNDFTTVLTLTGENHLWIGNSEGIDRNEEGTWTSFNPESGDEYIFRVHKNFTHADEIRFSTSGSTIDVAEAKQQLSDIAVVPNPYVVTAPWEPQHFYTSGRGERKIDFINLPSRCTIRIFTMRGYLVDTIEHRGKVTEGAVSWDLTSKDGLDVSYGIYIYHVEAPDIGEHIGKFALIK